MCGPVGVTVTTTDLLSDPPLAPAQVKVKVLVAELSAALVSEPAVARLPLQAPLAVHEVVLRDDQVSTVLAPLVTVVGVAVSVTVGADGELTETEICSLADPPGPEQLKL